MSAKRTTASREQTLAASVFLMLALVALQRGIGFGRSLLFCRWLPAEELGAWDLTYSFLLLAAPLLVLGLPGSFGRYVEHFRAKGALKAYLWKTGWIAAACVAAGVLAMELVAQPLAWLVFGEAAQTNLVRWAALALVGVIAFHALVELFTALRRTRVAAVLQVINSVAFAVVGVAALLLGYVSAMSVVAAYGVACVASALVGALPLKQWWHEYADAPAAIPQETPAAPTASANAATFSPTTAAILMRVAPFAAWLWGANLLRNLFEVADRWILVHGVARDPEVTRRLIGEYHTSRVFPMLLVAVVGLIAGVLLPHLAKEWEHGAKERANSLINRCTAATSLAVTVAGAILLLVAPWLFSTALGGKYATGLAILPVVLVACGYMCVTTVAMNFLWLAEKGRWSMAVFALGLGVNVALNAYLAPRWGLPGVALATAAANLAATLATVLISRQHGMPWAASTLLTLAIPITLAAGPLTAIYAALCGGCVLVVEAWTIAPTTGRGSDDRIPAQLFFRKPPTPELSN